MGRSILLLALVGLASCGGGGGKDNPIVSGTNGTCADFTGRWRLVLTPVDTTCSENEETSVDTLTATQNGCTLTATGSQTTYACTARDATLTCTASQSSGSGTSDITITATLDGNTLSGTALWRWSPGSLMAGGACGGHTTVSATRLSTPALTWQGSQLPFQATRLLMASAGETTHMVFTSSLSLQYANSASAWTVERLPIDTDVYALALSRGGVPHVAGSHFGGLELARREGGVWTSELVSKDYGYDVAVALDSQDHAHIVQHTTSSQLTYYTNRAGAWIEVPVITPGPSSIEDLRMAIDSMGAVHVVYQDSSNQNALVYASNASGTWQTRSLALFGMAPGLAIDDHDKVHIVFSSGGLSYASNVGGDFAVTEISPPGGSCHIPLALAKGLNGQLHLACCGEEYVNNTWQNEIVYGFFSGGAWDLMPVFVQPREVSVSDIAISSDPQGYAQIAWGSYGDKASSRFITSRP